MNGLGTMRPSGGAQGWLSPGGNNPAAALGAVLDSSNDTVSAMALRLFGPSPSEGRIKATGEAPQGAGIFPNPPALQIHGP